MLRGLLPNEEFSMEELNRRILEGRFYEIRMLYYLGKDLARWIDQSMELVDRDETLREAGIRKESFAAMLVEDPPEAVAAKLLSWGVTEHKAIFRRALGLNTVFAEAPQREDLTDEFVRHHYRYTDGLYECRQQSAPFNEIRGTNFPFELYSSGEYSKFLEKQWEEY